MTGVHVGGVVRGGTWFCEGGRFGVLGRMQCYAENRRESETRGVFVCVCAPVASKHEEWVSWALYFRRDE